jgi:class 3 adenylate cyclase
VLLAALPPRVVSEDRSPTGTGEAIDTATAVAVAVDVGTEDLRAGETVGTLFATVAGDAERLAAERGLERVRAAADRHLFVAGLGDEDPCADAALAFAADLTDRVAEIAREEGVDVRLRVGISTGLVQTGLLRLGNLSFTAWGEPVRNAMVIGTMSETGAVGVAATTARAATEGRWQLEPAPPLRDPDDQPIEVFTLVTAPATESSDSTVG